MVGAEKERFPFSYTPVSAPSDLPSKVWGVSGIHKFGVQSFYTILLLVKLLFDHAPSLEVAKDFIGFPV